MHILLTDIASCPRCGPEFGLIVLADALAERRVREGVLGCANCLQKYPIHAGVADLRFPVGAPFAGGAAHGTGEPTEEEVFRAAALLGVASGPATLLLVGMPVSLAERLATLLAEVEIATVEPLPAEARPLPISRIAAAGAVPLRSRSVHGVLAAARAVAALRAEIVRVARPAARLVVPDAGPRTAHELRAAGLEILLDEDGVVVASTPPNG